MLSPSTRNRVLLALCAIAAYALTLPRALPDADAGEFAVLAADGGVAHPPGYPLYVLLLRAVGLFSTSIPVLAGLSALLAGLAIVVLPAGIVGLALAFFSAPVWRASTTIEPFALNLLLAAGVMACGQRVEDRRCAALLGLLFGLGVCNHHTLALLVPGTLVLLFPSWRNLPYAVAGFFAGLLPLLQLVLANHDAAFVWGDWNAPGQLLHHVLRRDYGTFSLAGDREGTQRGLLVFLSELPRFVGWVGVPLVIAGIATVSRRGKPGIAMLVHLVMTAVLFPWLMQLKWDAAGHVIGERFFALPLVVMGIFASWGAEVLLARVQWAALAFIAFHVVIQLPDADRSSHTFSAMHISNALDHLPKDAVIITGSDADHFALLYGHVVEKRAPGAVIVDAQLWKAPWYRERMRRLHPFLDENLLATQRPIFLTFEAHRALGPVEAMPWGPFQRVGAFSVEDALRENERLLDVLQFPDELESSDAWEATQLANYWWTWKRLEDAFVSTGDAAKTAACQKVRVMLERGVRKSL